MTTLPAKVLLLGSGELGKEVAIAAQRLGCHVIACDRYAAAPAMQVADVAEVLPMTDADALLELIQTDPVKEKLKQTTQAAADRGAFGVPTFFVGDEIFFGKERLGQIEEELLKQG